MGFHLLLSLGWGWIWVCNIDQQKSPHSEAKGKYQEISLGFRKNLLPLSGKTRGAMNTSDRAIACALR
jgi:hypothetical protein